MRETNGEWQIGERQIGSDKDHKRIKLDSSLFFFFFSFLLNDSRYDPFPNFLWTISRGALWSWINIIIDDNYDKLLVSKEHKKHNEHKLYHSLLIRALLFYELILLERTLFYAQEAPLVFPSNNN